MESKIEQATIDDLKDIQNLNFLLFKKEHDEFDNTLNCEWTMSEEGKKYFTARINGGCLLVARVDNKIVGYLNGGIHNKKTSHRTIPVFAELENMFVLDEYRNKGIGTKLYLAFENWCKSKGAQRIQLFAFSRNIAGINFYRKNGLDEYGVVLESDI